MFHPTAYIVTSFILLTLVAWMWSSKNLPNIIIKLIFTLGAVWGLILVLQTFVPLKVQ